MFIYPDRSVELAPEEKAAIPAAVEAWVTEMDGRGVRLQGHVLAPGSEAATVKVRGGEAIVNDGTLSEATAEISGFNILECADLDEALVVSAKHPVATFGTLELRPFAES
jgi:hypothetical protein